MIDTEHRDEVVCPHCGWSSEPNFQFLKADGDWCMRTCLECKEMFTVTMHVTTTYTTKKRRGKT